MVGTAEPSERWVACPVAHGQLIAGKYIAQEVVGIGGMGVVVAAHDRVLDRPVAIKFLLARLASSDVAVQRFIREARSAARLSSEHVVRILEIDELETGIPFFVMEYLAGRDLRGLLVEERALQPTVAVEYVLQALQAVAEAHGQQVIHRDLKPSNLFLAQRADGSALIKVVDFGIAKSLEPSLVVDDAMLTQSGDGKLGSPAYMSPEQLRSARDVDHRTDIWSLGVTLYELLTGELPFGASNYPQLVSQILFQPPEALRSRPIARSVSPKLEQIILTCLAKDPARRFQNAVDLARALAPFGGPGANVSLTAIQGIASGRYSAVPRAADRITPFQNGRTTTATVSYAGATRASSVVPAWAKYGAVTIAVVGLGVAATRLSGIAASKSSHGLRAESLSVPSSAVFGGTRQEDTALTAPPEKRALAPSASTGPLVANGPAPTNSAEPMPRPSAQAPAGEPKKSNPQPPASADPARQPRSIEDLIKQRH